MKKLLTMVAVAVMLFGVTPRDARATLTNIAFDTKSVDGILDPVNQFDWNAGSGAAYLSDGTQYVPGTILTPGQQITFLYQANLSAFNSSPGTPIGGLTGLNSAYEITIVASLTETVKTFLTDGVSVATATFQTSGGTAKIYYDNITAANPDGGLKSSPTPGTGFEDGTKILQGTVQPGDNSTFTFFFGDSTGLGATNITAVINPTFLDTSFFLLPGSHLAFSNLHDIDFTGQLGFPPPSALNTDAYFVGGDNPFAAVLSPGNDFLVDGTNQFTVPEPASMLLLGSGLMGLAGFLRRKSKKVN